MFHKTMCQSQKATFYSDQARETFSTCFFDKQQFSFHINVPFIHKAQRCKVLLLGVGKHNHDMKIKNNNIKYIKTK